MVGERLLFQLCNDIKFFTLFVLLIILIFGNRVIHVNLYLKLCNILDGFVSFAYFYRIYRSLNRYKFIIHIVIHVVSSNI